MRREQCQDDVEISFTIPMHVLYSGYAIIKVDEHHQVYDKTQLRMHAAQLPVVMECLLPRCTLVSATSVQRDHRKATRAEPSSALGIEVSSPLPRAPKYMPPPSKLLPK